MAHAHMSDAARRLIEEALAANPELAKKAAEKNESPKSSTAPACTVSTVLSLSAFEDKSEKICRRNKKGGGEGADASGAAAADGDEASAGADGGAVKSRTIEFPLCDVNPYIVCRLCAGYLIGATTITECLHTFCKSCIVKYFQTSKHCPTCGIMVHETNPMEMLRQDRTMQSIVLKLVPHVQEEEERRRREFYLGKEEGEQNAGQAKGGEGNAPKKAKTEEAPQTPILDADGDRISFQLCKELEDAEEQRDAEQETNIKDLERPFIRTSARATIHSLKKFLAAKMQLSGPDDVDILCRGEVLGKEYTLEYILRTRWRKNNIKGDLLHLKNF